MSDVVLATGETIVLTLPYNSGTDVADVEEVSGTCSSTTFAMNVTNSGQANATFTFTAGTADMPADTFCSLRLTPGVITTSTNTVH